MTRGSWQAVDMTRPQNTVRGVTSLGFVAASFALGCDGTTRNFDEGPTAGETLTEPSNVDPGAETQPDDVTDATLTVITGEPASISGLEDESTAGPTTSGASASGAPGEASNAGEVPSSAALASSVEPATTDAAGTNETTGLDATSNGVPATCDAVLLRNGDFESGAEHWAASSSYGAFEQRVHPLIVEVGHESLATYTVSPHDGTRMAFLGDVPDDEYMGYHTTLTQAITIPEDSAGLWLTGRVWVNTSETENTEFDYAYIQIEPSDDEDKYLQFAFWTNLDASDGWIEIDEYMPDVSALRGREVNLVVQALTDANVATRFWFDSLALVSLCPE